MSSMDFDFFTIDGLEEDIKKTLKQLNKMEKAFKSEACKKAVEEAAPILLEEEKQQLKRVTNYGKFKALNPSWLTSKTYQYANGHWIAQCGYPTEIIEKHPEVVIVEFGKPGHGKKAIKKHGKDKIGRKIGVVQPRPHIRTALFSKKDEINKKILNVLLDEAERIWKENG